MLLHSIIAVEVLGNKSANVIVKAGSKTVEQETEGELAM